MKSMRLVAAMAMLVFCLGSALAQPITKTRTIVVNVQLDANCAQGISLTGDILGERELCADEPVGIGNYFQRYVGSDIEVEARWTFDGNPKTDAPVSVGKILKIGRDKVSDPTALATLDSVHP